MIYLCGGIQGLNDEECKGWREEAKQLLKLPTLDPMDRDYRGKEGNFYTELVEQDLVDINNSVAIIVNASKPSWGTAMEIRYAFGELKIPVIVFTENSNLHVNPWLRYHSTQLFLHLTEACNYINIHFNNSKL